MKNKFVLSLCILVLSVMFSVSCFAAEKYLFLVVGPMTGDSAAQGIQMKTGAELAMNEINKTGGINGKEMGFVVADDVADPNQAVIIAQKYSGNDDLLFVLGHNNSNCSIAALPTWEAAGIPVLSPCNSSPLITQLGHKNYFRVVANDNIQTNQMVRLAVLELGCKNIAFLWENTDYGRGSLDWAKNAIPEYGGTLVADASFAPAKDRDFSSQITTFKGAGADGVLIIGEYTGAALFCIQAKSFGLDAKIIGSGGCANPKLIEIAGEAAEGYYAIAAFDPNDTRPKQANFIKIFEDALGDRPGEWGANSYDLVHLVAKGIEGGGITREKLIEVLHQDDFEYEGVTGLIKFDEYGDVPDKSSLFLLVKDGKFTTYIPEKF
ncbi:MAG: ABC transporter substrate-binding protein [Actinobacteria bacterium]|nr:ABC transporter substrate-binding protein [Actinomycetota bacterium]